jgi:RNA-splicing ligase RtcB
MHGIVRRAQRDFQFSVIYEHRKTNQILVAGFKNLAQAVEEMASRITASIDSLTTSVDKMTSTLDESLRRLSEQTERLATGAAEKSDRDAAGKCVREQRVLEMLDRIERQRYRSAMQASAGNA